MGLRLSVSNPEFTTITELPKSHCNVGRVQIINGIHFAHIFDLRIPCLSLLNIHYEFSKHDSVTGPFHRCTPTQNWRSQVLKVVDSVNLMNNLPLVFFNSFPLVPCWGFVINSFKSSPFTSTTTREGKLRQWRHSLDPSKHFIEIGKLNLHSTGLRRRSALQRHFFLKHGRGESCGCSGIRGDQQNAEDACCLSGERTPGSRHDGRRRYLHRVRS
mmetsp:Transcript_9770/g.19220  ORF Transcript_9770/g.19220 Transcript_9770/m.19220 type:complete len:215 (-) Transcript_9770:195-839(-)